MELKNAVSVCLIALCSAALVLVIARWLDNQAASRLEPRLAEIVDELRAIRRSGGISTSANGRAESEPADCLMVYYFHGNTRCPTCRDIESQSHATVTTDFAEQLKTKEVVWSILNYEEPATASLAKKFEVQMPVVVLARRKGGEIEQWKRLDPVWALVGDKAAFGKYIHDQIDKMLTSTKPQNAETPAGDAPAIPVPNSDTTNIPVPAT
jgi:hypothetical protein